MVLEDDDRRPDDSDHHVRDADTADRSERRSPTDSETSQSSPPRLGSRILVTWLELTVVGILGGILGVSIGGPPGFVIYLLTTLLTVAIVFHNVNELVKEWLRTERHGRSLE
ncbi:hypothetical protein [Natrinema sp. HArc-T2]|uniref:hypothetical protein n=1 Tax=Natrinema sp. HArc-T2 TaxID=3242701 RepID=UPI00359DC260